MPSEYITNMINGEIDVLSFSAWATANADEVIDRRLEDPVESWNHYIAYLKGIKAVFTQTSGTVIVDGVEVTSIQQLIDDAREQAIAAAGYTPYPTYAALIADAPNLDVKLIYEVTNDTNDINGRYTYDGTELTKSDYDPLTQSKTYTDNEIKKKISITEETEIAFAIEDELGYRGFTIDSAGRLGNIVITELDDRLSDAELALENFSPSPVAGLETKIRDNKADYMHWFSYGQSLARGATSYPLISTSQPYQNKTFAAGVLARIVDETTAGFDSFKPLVEMIDGTDGETPTSSMINNFVKSQQAKGDDTTNWQMIGSAPGRGGQTITNLDKGSSYYTGLIAQVQAAYDIAQAEGKTYCVFAMSWTQGENNYSGTYNPTTSQQYYYDTLIQLKNDFAADVTAITGRDFVAPWVMGQTASHREYNQDEMWVAKAQLQVANTDPDFILACSIYPLPHHTDDLHLTVDSSYQLGLYYKRALDYTLSRGEKWQPLQPVNTFRQGLILDVEFNKSGLAIDTTLVVETHNKGFDLRDSAGILLDIITSVTVSDTNRVRILLSQTPPAGAFLSYGRGRAGDPVAGGPISGPRGNLRDSAGDADNYVDSQVVTRYMHNWCVMFEKTI